MRNVFDQYSQQENRLTHALACCLHEDQDLLKSFASWIDGRAPIEEKLRIIEQSLPGQPVLYDEVVGNSLPDAWIYGDGEWSLLIESKVQASIDRDQLSKHLVMAHKRGFEEARVVLISVEAPKHPLPSGVSFRRWTEVYEWFMRQRSEWASRMVDYMEILEAQMTSSEYLTSGSLTTFTGVHFNNEHPYSALEAKRLLKLAMEEIRKDKRLDMIGVDSKLPGRGSIKETGEVWDFVRLACSRDEKNFTEYPHFTFGLRSTHVLAVLLLPNNMKSRFRRNLKTIGGEGFRATIHRVARELSTVLGNSPHAAPWIVLKQRHWETRSRPPVNDGIIEFDLRTASPANSDGGCEESKVKMQKQWLDGAFDALTHKTSNLEAAIGARISYDYQPLRTPDIVSTIVKSWLACKPLLDLVLGEQE